MKPARLLEPEEGTPADFTIVREKPKAEKDILPCAEDMARSLVCMGSAFFRLTAEADRLIGEGWKEPPRVQAEFVSPPAVTSRSGLAMDLRPADRARLRAIVRKTHRWVWRDEPTDALCDELIDNLGPEVAADMVKQARDAGQVG